MKPSADVLSASDKPIIAEHDFALDRSHREKTHVARQVLRQRQEESEKV
jgi:hypothetical protein